MGQIRSLSRRFGPRSRQFSAAFEVFCFCSALLSGGAARCHPARPLLCSPSPSRRRGPLLALSFGRLLGPASPREWRSVGPQLCEWALHLARDPRAPEEVRGALAAAFPAFKAMDSYSEASVWSRLIPL